MREHCLKEFDAHWDCLEWNNQRYNVCRKEERPLNKCMFDALVRAFPPRSALVPCADEPTLAAAGPDKDHSGHARGPGADPREEEPDLQGHTEVARRIECCFFALSWMCGAVGGPIAHLGFRLVHCGECSQTVQSACEFCPDAAMFEEASLY
jgi:hypothetical protein